MLSKISFSLALLLVSTSAVNLETTIKQDDAAPAAAEADAAPAEAPAVSDAAETTDAAEGAAADTDDSSDDTAEAQTATEDDSGDGDVADPTVEDEGDATPASAKALLTAFSGMAAAIVALSF